MPSSCSGTFFCDFFSLIFRSLFMLLCELPHAEMSTYLLSGALIRRLPRQNRHSFGVVDREDGASIFLMKGDFKTSAACR